MAKPVIRVKAGSYRFGVDAVKADAGAFGLTGNQNPSFEAAGRGRRLATFNPPRVHINTAIRRAGGTLLSRARWLYENDGYCGNAVDEWGSHAVGDGIKPRPRLKNKAEVKRDLLDRFWEWTEDADADGQTDYYGLQAKAAREVFLAGEVFFRIRPRRPGDMATVPFQLQLLESEMLDLSFEGAALNGNRIRAGIEFNAINKRVAYHFWRFHPNDEMPSGTMNVRVRVPAEEVIHILDGRQGSQIRGVPRVARILVKIFGLEVYDDAELERKQTAALFTAFLTGRGDNPIAADDEDEEEDGAAVAPMQPGAIVDLGDDKDVKFSSPADVGGSYEPFQYRNLLKICAGLGIPYAIVTGDVKQGNFSNVRTDIIRFRRRVSQWTNHIMIPQFCRVVWRQFVERGYIAGIFDLPDYDTEPAQYWQAEHLPPRQEWIDPAKDVAAAKEEVLAGFKSRTQVVAERGYDREELDDEIEEERESAASRTTPLIFDTDAGTAPTPVAGAPSGNSNAVKPDEEPAEPEEEDAAPDA